MPVISEIDMAFTPLLSEPISALWYERMFFFEENSLFFTAVKNKEFSSKKNIRSYHKALMGSDRRGVNAMSISEITGIPRPTVVRKLKFLIDKKYLHINEKKLITFDAKDSAFQKTGKMINQNMLSLSNFIYKIFNQIRIINP